MPAVSEKQRKAMGAALAAKRGGKVKKGSPSSKMAKSMSEGQLKDFAKKPKGKK
jgi:hypothetical protein